MTAPASPPLPVIYACSGASDAGELADRIARRLTQDGHGRMSCLAGVGGRVRPLLLTAQRAPHILVIDGCPMQCARHTLEAAGVTGFAHFKLPEAGLHKGRCPVTPENIGRGARAALLRLQDGREGCGLADATAGGAETSAPP